MADRDYKQPPTREFLVLGHGDALDAAVDQLGDELREKKLRTMLTAAETRFVYELDKALTRADVTRRHPEPAE